MTPERLFNQTLMYEQRLRENDIPKARMDPKRSFSSLSQAECLMHAHYLCDGIREYAKDPEQWGKANRHYASLQLCLSFGGWYTLKELMEHNKE